MRSWLKFKQDSSSSIANPIRTSELCSKAKNVYVDNTSATIENIFHSEHLHSSILYIISTVATWKEGRQQKEKTSQHTRCTCTHDTCTVAPSSPLDVLLCIALLYYTVSCNCTCETSSYQRVGSYRGGTDPQSVKCYLVRACVQWYWAHVLTFLHEIQFQHFSTKISPEKLESIATSLDISIKLQNLVSEHAEGWPCLYWSILVADPVVEESMCLKEG